MFSLQIIKKSNFKFDQMGKINNFLSKIDCKSTVCVFLWMKTIFKICKRSIFCVKSNHCIASTFSTQADRTLHRSLTIFHYFFYQLNTKPEQKAHSVSRGNKIIVYSRLQTQSRGLHVVNPNFRNRRAPIGGNSI